MSHPPSEPERFINIVLFLAIGVYLIIYGAKSRTLINDSEVMATKQERRGAAATPARRIAVVTAGVAAIVYGIVLLIR